MGYLSHKWPRLCSVCRNHNLTLSLLVTYQWVCNKSNTTGTIGEIRTAYPSGRHEFIPGFCSICRFVHIVCTSLCVLLSFFFWSLYYQFFLLTVYDYHVGIFKLFLQCHMSWFLFVVTVRFVKIVQSFDDHVYAFLLLHSIISYIDT